MTPPPFSAVVVRASKPEWSYSPESGDGAAKHGGRFNLKGMPALYTSLTLETCTKEVRFSLNQIPYTFYCLKVESSRIPDLTGPSVRKALNVDWSDLACPNWESDMNKGLVPNSQRLAARLASDGYHGILVPSFAPLADDTDVNLVLWHWKPAADKGGDPDECAWVETLEADFLPKSRASWSP